jgi:23S rRNA (adenine2503-C2)-methyltransferase
VTGKIDLRNFTFRQLEEYVAGLGHPSFRAKQIFSRLQRPGAVDFSRMKNVSRELLAVLGELAGISRLDSFAVEESRDGTIKFGFRLDDGALIESVLIPEEGRHTLCLSSQSGCSMGCRFCLTGADGFTRNLRPAEIVNQVIAVMEHMVQSGVVRSSPRQLVNNLVFMGMGEPLANYDNLLTALDILMDERGLGFTQRRVTVSTCGIIPGIADLGRDVRVNLAVSLHSADDMIRGRLMPVNRKYPVDDLLAACRRYPLSGRKMVFIECVLMKGINDTAADARLLADKLRGLPCIVNLLPFNESPSLPYRSPDRRDVDLFRGILKEAGFVTVVRSSRGADISAACGQLAGGK